MRQNGGVLRWFRAAAVACAMLGSLPLGAQDFRYEVQPGDSLWSIASRYLRDIKDLPALSRLNGLRDPGRIVPGTAVRIPVTLMREVMMAGTVFSVTGEVLRRAPQSRSPRPLQPGEKFNERDVLQAGLGSAATLLLPDGSKIRMAEGAEIEVLRMRRFADTMLFDSRLRLARGRVETEVRPLGGGGRFEILTPAAVTSVRGTDYRVRALDASAVTEVVEGRVGFGNPQGTTDVPAGFGARAEAGRAPAPPRPLLPAPDLAGLPGVLGATPAPLVFAAPGDASAYRVQLAGDPDFARPIIDRVVDAPVVDLPPLPDGDLHVRIRAIDDDGIEGLEARRTLRVSAPPAKADLVSPSDRHLAPAGAVRFQWRVSGGALRSRLEFAHDARFTDIAGVHETDGTELVLEPPFAEDRRLHWRVVALGRDSAAEPSGGRVIRRPPAIADLPSEVVVAPSAGLGWTALPGVSGYRVQVVPEGGPGVAPVFDGEVDRPALPAGTLLPGRYRLRVQGGDADGTRGPWGPYVPLEVREAPLAAPAPVSGAELARARVGVPGPTLAWSAPAWPPNGFRLQVAGDPDFSEIVLDRRIGATTRVDLPETLPAGRYHWRVAAVGHTLESGFSTTGVVERLPATGAIARAEFTQGRDPLRLAWPPVPGAASYRIDVLDGRDAAVATLASNGNAVPIDELPPGRYRWRIVALAADGTPGAPSAEADLLVHPSPLGPVDLLGPPEGSPVVSGAVSVRWSEMPGATGYVVEAAEDAGFSRNVRGVVVAGTTATLPVPDGVTRLYWRVMPVRGEERGPASAMRFVVQPPAPVAVMAVMADPAGLDVRLSPVLPGLRTCVEFSVSEDFGASVDRRCVAGSDVRIDSLVPGRWYLRARAVDAEGVQGPPGPVVSAEMPAVQPPDRPWWWWLPPFGILLLP